MMLILHPEGAISGAIDLTEDPPGAQDNHTMENHNLKTDMVTPRGGNQETITEVITGIITLEVIREIITLEVTTEIITTEVTNGIITPEEGYRDTPLGAKTGMHKDILEIHLILTIKTNIKTIDIKLLEIKDSSAPLAAQT